MLQRVPGRQAASCLNWTYVAAADRGGRLSEFVIPTGLGRGTCLCLAPPLLRHHLNTELPSRSLPLYNPSFMPITAEDRARQTIDRFLTDAGWLIQSRDETNINAARGATIREFP